jgi:hypothetical protein
MLNEGHALITPFSRKATQEVQIRPNHTQNMIQQIKLTS